MLSTAQPPEPGAPADAEAIAAVAAAYDTLIAALRRVIASVDAECDRATAFRRHELELAARWRDGRPPHGSGAPRARKGAVA